MKSPQSAATAAVGTELAIANEETPTTPTTDAISIVCTKLARTWMIASRGLDTSLLLAVRDSIDEAMDAMSDAGDQMEIEGCPTSLTKPALMGNYEAALASAKAQVCLNSGKFLCKDADRHWKKEGSDPKREVEIFAS